MLVGRIWQCARQYAQTIPVAQLSRMVHSVTNVSLADVLAPCRFQAGFILIHVRHRFPHDGIRLRLWQVQLTCTMDLAFGRTLF
jgi:hypothetical protein